MVLNLFSGIYERRRIEKVIYEAPEVNVEVMADAASASKGGPIEMPDHEF